MKILNIILCLGLFGFILPGRTFGQNVGINSSGASPDAVAMLDIASTTKGLLIPRVALTASNSNAPIGAGVVASLLVYNTATAGTSPNDVTPGFYYWNGSAWLRLQTAGAGTGWTTGGNSGTSAGTDFVGTTDAQAFDIRTNNTIKTRITTKGQIEIYNTGNSVFLGEGAGAADDLTTNQNVFAGYRAGNANTIGNSNTGVGTEALRSNTAGDNNTAVGFNALFSNISGTYNTAVGSQVLYSNTTGSDNNGIGRSALYFNTTGSFNTANGIYALENNTTGSANSAIGYLALRANTSGSENTANGRRALNSNTLGAFNTSMGSDALQLNTEGESNSGFGAYSLARNTLGNYNSASGSYALNLNETGNENTAEGYEAVYSNTTGNQNTGTGFEALYSSETGSNNAAIGYKSLFTNVTGSNNTAIGSDADVSSGALSNSTAIGNGATVGASNKIRLGNSSVTVIEGQVAYTFPSDARFKYNVKENVPGLTFIRNLKPVTYQFDTKKYDAHLMQNMVDSVREKRMKNVDYNSSSSIIHTGFLAQDIEKICKDLGIDFDGLHTPDANNNTDHYSLAYSQFIMPLVKAVQEQQSTIDSLNLSNKTLQTDLNTLKVEVEAIKASISQK